MSRPTSAVLGRRPAATRISSAVMIRPSCKVAVTGASSTGRRAVTILAPVMMVMPSAARALPSCSPANGSSLGSSRPAASTTVTSVLPRRRQAWAISVPTGPPPRTRSRSGTCLAEVTWRLSQIRISRSPSTGGTAAVEPVARMTARAADSRRREPSRASTSTHRSPASRPRPRTRVAPTPASQSAWFLSSQPAVIQSRRASALPTSRSPVTA